MNKEPSTIYSKIVAISEAELSSVDLPSLSNEVKQIIAASGAPSLKPMIGPEATTVIREMLKDYWRRPG